MPKFYIYENVPQYVSYRKTIEADSAEQAQAIAAADWSDIDSAEEGPFLDGDALETVPVTYEAVEETAQAKEPRDLTPLPPALRSALRDALHETIGEIESLRPEQFDNEAHKAKFDARLAALHNALATIE